MTTSIDVLRASLAASYRIDRQIGEGGMTVGFKQSLPARKSPLIGGREIAAISVTLRTWKSMRRVVNGTASPDPGPSAASPFSKEDVHIYGRHVVTTSTVGATQRHRSQRCLATLLVLSCVQPDAGLNEPPAGPTVASVALSQDTATLVPEASVTITAVARDAEGAAISRTVAWTTSDPARARVTQQGIVTGLRPGSVTITAASEGRSASASVTVKEGSVIGPAGGSVSAREGVIELLVPSGAVAAPTMFTIDTAANTPGLARVLQGSVVTLGPSGRAFSTAIRLTVRYQSAQLPNAAPERLLALHRLDAGAWHEVLGSQVNVSARAVTALLASFSTYGILTAVPVASVELANAPAIALGASTLLSATVRASDGTPLADRDVQWTSNNSLVASVSATGLVTGLAVGNASITATSEGRSAAANVEVFAAGSPLIASIAPAVLLEGQTAIIRGSSLSAIAAENDVRVGGLVAAVVLASADSLVITVPTSCRPKGLQPVQVRVAGRSGNTVLNPVSPSVFIQPAIGELTTISTPADLCLQFDASGQPQRYAFGVQSVSSEVANIVDVRVEGLIPAGAQVGVALEAPSFASTGGQQAFDQGADRWRRHLAVTSAAYEQDRLYLQPIADRVMSAPARAASATTVPGSVAEGDVVNIRFPSFGQNTCTTFTPIAVKVRRITAHGIFVEDVGNPIALDQAVIDQAGASFASVYQHEVDYFGTPRDFDGNQRIVIVFTKEVNKVPNPPTGFVGLVNLLPASQCAASNEGEFFYMRAVDSGGQYGAGPYSVQNFERDFPNTVLHEFAHIIQGSRRLAAGGQFMSSWLAEGLASGAQEVIGMQLLGLQEGQNYGADKVFSSLGADPREFFGYTTDLLIYFGFDFAGSRIDGAPERCTWVGSTATGGNPGPCTSRRILYGVPWSLIKYTIDRHLGGVAQQKQFLRAFSDYSGPLGFPELESVLGRSVASMLSEWAPMLLIDDRYPAIVNFQLANWNIRSIAAAYRSPAADLSPRSRGFQPFSDDVSVRAGSSAFYEISASSRPATAIRIRDRNGLPLPAHFQVWIVRVQ